MDRQAYRDLVARYVERRPYGFRHAGELDLQAEHLHTVLLAHPDMALEALSSKHFAQDITDELNSVYGPETEDARLAEKVRQYLLNAAESQLFEDVREAIWARDEAEEEAETDFDTSDRARDMNSVVAL